MEVIGNPLLLPLLERAGGKYVGVWGCGVQSVRRFLPTCGWWRC